ncbi:DUF4352 domain-containing protein [Mycobacterium camsae]|uniref:DUF4352 domain-containing protein n=1 Tax=Mycobacterium gordonae TaxID=1778 RepID=UPI00197F65B4|nr:DUF4352 domain-containing protein [Mycobacterium gordonae]
MPDDQEQQNPAQTGPQTRSAAQHPERPGVQAPTTGQHPGYYPPPTGYYQQPPRKRKVWPWILLGIVVLFFGGCFAVVGVVGSSIDSASKNNGSSGNSTASGQGATAPGIGQEVRDGKFAFTVTDVQRGQSAGTATARGEFIIVTMTVKNTGSEPQSYFTENQTLFDSAGRKYAADSTAGLSMNRDSMVINLNPGFDLAVQVPFDVPVGTQPAAIEVHDSAFSGGSKIRLS